MVGQPKRRAVRWTEHGPVPIDDDEPAPASPVDTPEPPAPPVPARKPRMRWTEHGPEPIEDAVDPATTAAPSDEDGAAAVRARLEARGLLRSQPAVRIRDVSPTMPARPPLVADEPGPPAEPGAVDGDHDDDAAEALEPDPGGATAPVRCRSCRSTQPVSIAATGYRCDTCRRVWRWAVCPSCDHLELAFARQESWRCSSCGTGTRSWWRTVNAPNESVAVADRKRLDAGRIRRRRVLDAGRRYRTAAALVAAGLALVLAAAIALPRLAEDDTATEQATSTCADFRALEADLTQGAVAPASLRGRLDDLATGAAEAAEPVRIGAERLAASGRPGDAAFEEARTALAAACGSN